MTTTTETPKVIKTAIFEAIDHLPPEYLDDVLQFIQFLEFKATITPDDPAEDEALWEAVQANQAYKQQHPDEKPEKYESGDEFLKAVSDL